VLVSVIKSDESRGTRVMLTMFIGVLMDSVNTACVTRDGRGEQAWFSREARSGYPACRLPCFFATLVKMLEIRWTSVFLPWNQRAPIALFEELQAHAA